MATTIPQRELRNQAGAVLRRAEQGERFTITVDGRPVAELGPLPGTRQPAPPEALTELLSETPVDRGWASELRAMRDTEAAA
jgi:prevent-host-death family protein